MPLIPNNQTAQNNSITVRVPIPTQVQPTTVQKPPEPAPKQQEQAQDTTFTRAKIRPHSIILPYNSEQAEQPIQNKRKKKQKLKDIWANAKRAKIWGDTGQIIVRFSKNLSGDKLTDFPEVKGFHKAMEAQPTDTLPHLVFADWLDEHHFPAHAEMVRHHIDKIEKGVQQKPTEQQHGYQTYEGAYATYLPKEYNNTGKDILSLYLNSHINRRSFYYSAYLPREHAFSLAQQLENEGTELGNNLSSAIKINNMAKEKPIQNKRKKEIAALWRKINEN